MKVNDLTRTLLAIKREDRAMKRLGYRRAPAYWIRMMTPEDVPPIDVLFGLHGVTYTRFR